MSLESRRGLLTIDSRGRQEGVVSALTGFRPRALLLWWAERDGSGADGGNRGGIGLHADGGGGVAHAWFADDRVSTDAIAHAVSELAVLALRSPFAGVPACRGEATLRDDGFALQWHATSDAEWDVHYLAFGGQDLREAGVAGLELAHDRPRMVADVGFRPDFALFVPTAAGSAGDPSPGLFYGIGATAGPHRQGAVGVGAQVVDGSAIVRSAQRSDCVVALPNVEGAAPFRALVRTVEFGSSGPVLDVAVDPAASPVPVACLALAGGRYSVGTHAGPRRPRRDRTRRLGFAPVGVLALSWGLASFAEIKEVPRLCLGAADPAGCGCLSWMVRPRGKWPLEPRSRSIEGRLLEVVDTRGGPLHAQARLAALDRDGFTLEWPESDGRRREFVYAAFGSTESRPRRMRLIDVVRRLVIRHRPESAVPRGSSRRPV